jgi:hypothetical protein
LIEIIQSRFNKVEEKEKLIDLIITNISDKIDFNDLKINYNSSNNFKIIKFIYENTLYTGNKYKYLLNLDNLISEIFNNINSNQNQTKDETVYSECINLYWKYLIFNLGSDSEKTFDVISEKLLNKNNSKNYQIVLSSLIQLANEEIKIFPEKSINFFKKLLNLIKGLKSTNLELLKNIFKLLIENLYVNIFILL